MLTSIHIEGFKGFKDTLVAPLRKVNLILGGQNVGKTSLLEAVYLGASDINNFKQLPALFRLVEGGDSQRYLQSVLGKKAKWLVDLAGDKTKVLRTTNSSNSDRSVFFDSSRIEVDGRSFNRFLKDENIQWEGEMRQKISVGLSVNEILFLNPLSISVHLPSQLDVARLFDTAVMLRKKKILLDMLRCIDPRLEDMHSLLPDGEQRIYVELEGDGVALPLPQLGHGFSRLVYLYCSLLVTDAKLALIDEVENGIHYSSLPTLFQGIQDIAAKHDVQTLMTTHSWDCIRAAYKTFADAGNLEDFQLIRLERDNDNIRAVVINDEMLETVMEAGYEVR